LIGLTILWTNGRPAVSPELDPRRARFVLGRIDEILTWEKSKEKEGDVRFVELGEYLCEVRSKQYWRLEKLGSFEEFLGKRFPESRRKAYYLMAIHENLTRIPKPQLREVGWSKAVELVKVSKWRGGMEKTSIVQPGCTRPKECQRRDLRVRSNGTSRGKRPSLGRLSTSSFTRASYQWSIRPLKQLR